MPRQSKPLGRRPRRAPLRWALATIVALACFAAVTAAPARAGTSCDTTEQVACIPLPSATSNPSGAAQPGSAGSNAASVAGPLIPCSPASCCAPVVPGGPFAPAPVAPSPDACPPPNPCSPYAVPAPAATSGSASAALPIPIPPPVACNPYQAIYSTINLGNAADVRALRTTSADGLSRYWRQSALSQLQAQVAYLQSVDDYANARLYSIQVQTANLDLLSSTAHVQTLEHWLYQERSSYDGSLVYNQDEWVTNNYVLTQESSGWHITSDSITAVAVPAGS